MKNTLRHLPTVITVLLCAAALIYGPITQPANYHDFADRHTVLCIPHFADVISNVGFSLVAGWGWLRLQRLGDHPEIRDGWAGYRLFLIGLFFTALGSAYYHLEPDNLGLFWDRLPIALACGGLLAGVWGDTRQKSSALLSAALAIFAVASVLWWYITELGGTGDLRPYLLLQGLPILLIPLWQGLSGQPTADRWAFGGALLLYIFAKITEQYDHEIAGALGILTGHTLKHLLATAAAALIIARLVRRTQTTQT